MLDNDTSPPEEDSVLSVKGGLQRRKSCAFQDMGCISYAAGMELQKKACERVRRGEWDGVVLLLEHEPVITVGRGGGLENLLVEKSELRDQGIALALTERGGNITCHNPGQLVVYPILNLKKWRQDVHWYVRTLEATIIETLARYSLDGERKSGLTGVWINDEKIAAIGIFISQWITSHGLALNICNDLGHFKHIVPCGISHYGITNMLKCGVFAGISDIKSQFLIAFQSAFDCELKCLDRSASR